MKLEVLDCNLEPGFVLLVYSRVALFLLSEEMIHILVRSQTHRLSVCLFLGSAAFVVGQLGQPVIIHEEEVDGFILGLNVDGPHQILDNIVPVSRLIYQVIYSIADDDLIGNVTVDYPVHFTDRKSLSDNHLALRKESRYCVYAL